MVLLFGACDVGINPLIFDGTVAAVSIRIETQAGEAALQCRLGGEFRHHPRCG
jgi:hypothetical protein